MNISIVIPAFNASKTILQTLQSCIDQTCKPYEIIVVDDCSTDNTAEIIRQFPYPVILLIQKTNQGPASARNVGWNYATGDIITFLDADDTFHPKKLETISKTFEQHQSAVFVGHPYTLSSFNTLQYTISALQRIKLHSILISNPFQSSCISVRRSLKERFTEGMRYCEDQDFAIRIAYYHGCFLLPWALTRLGRPQLTAGGASANLWKMRTGELKAYSALWRYNILFIFILPLLWMFSLLKYLRVKLDSKSLLRQ